MSMALDECRPGTRVWVLATGFWRRGLVVAPLRVNVIIRYALQHGGTRDARVNPRSHSVQPASFDPVVHLDADPAWADRMVAKASLWD